MHGATTNRPYRYVVGGAIIWLFGIFPTILLVSSRSATFFLISTFFVVCVGMIVSNSVKERFAGFVEVSNNANRDFAGWLLIICGSGLLIWSIVSLAWSPLVSKGIKDIIVVAGAVMSFWMLSREFRLSTYSHFKVTILVGISVGMVVLLIDMQVFRWAYKAFDASNEYFDLNRNAATLAVLIWPALAIIGMKSAKSGAAVLLLLALCLAAIYSSDGQSAQSGVVAGLIAGLLTWFSRTIYRAVIAGMAIGILAFPLAVPYMPGIFDKLPQQFIKAGNAEHRIAIWSGYTELIRENPVRGQGMRAHRKLGMDGSAGRFAVAAGFPAKTTHPHSFILETWINLGAIGATLLSGILLAVGVIGDTLARQNRVLLAQILTSAYVVSAVGHGFTQTWWIAAVAMAAISANLAMYWGAHWGAGKKEQSV